MAEWSFTVGTWTPTAVADANAMTGSGYMALQGGSSTQLINLLEVFMGGQATASSPSIMVLGRDSTVGASSITALSTPNSNGALHPSTAALAAVPAGFVTAGTQPQRSNSVTMAKLNLSFNAFGGVVRWYAMLGEEYTILGNTASLGEVSLSAFTGGTPGLMGSHFIYEPM